MIRIVGRRPMASDSQPSGNCISAPPTIATPMYRLISEIEKPARWAYTGPKVKTIAHDTPDNTVADAPIGERRVSATMLNGVGGAFAGAFPFANQMGIAPATKIAAEITNNVNARGWPTFRRTCAKVSPIIWETR